MTHLLMSHGQSSHDVFAGNEMKGESECPLCLPHCDSRALIAKCVFDAVGSLLFRHCIDNNAASSEVFPTIISPMR